MIQGGPLSVTSITRVTNSTYYRGEKKHIPIGSMGLVYFPTFVVNVVKYTSPMDP